MKRIAFGVLWFVVIFVAAVLAASWGPSGDAADVADAYEAGQSIGRQYGRLILFGSALVAGVGTALGVLPGTRKRR